MYKIGLRLGMLVSTTSEVILYAQHHQQMSPIQVGVVYKFQFLKTACLSYNLYRLTF